MPIKTTEETEADNPQQSSLFRGSTVLVGLALIGALIGFAVSAKEQWRTPQLQRDLERMTARVGEMEVVDPNMFHIRVIPSDVPMQFSWQIYVPAGATMETHTRIGSGSSGSSSSSRTQASRFVAMCSFYEEHGHLYLYERFGHSSSLGGIGSPAVGDFFIKHWKELTIEGLDAGKTHVIPQGKQAVLLKISLSPELKEIGKQELNPNDAQLISSSSWFQMTWGPEP